MAKLKLGAIVDDRPVKLTVELPGRLHRDLLAYAEVLARETGQTIPTPSKRGSSSALSVDPDATEIGGFVISFTRALMTRP
jgi:hypothetical protein